MSQFSLRHWHEPVTTLTSIDKATFGFGTRSVHADQASGKDAEGTLRHPGSSIVRQRLGSKCASSANLLTPHLAPLELQPLSSDLSAEL